MPSQFSTIPIELGRARLSALTPAVCERLAASIVAMPPWSVMNYPVDAMVRFLGSNIGFCSFAGGHSHHVVGDLIGLKLGSVVRL